MRIAAQAASELANAEGVCILSAAGDGCVVALAHREQLYVCDLRNSGLYRAASPLLRGEASGSRTLWGKEDFIALPTGEQLRIGVALIVPLQPATGSCRRGILLAAGTDRGLARRAQARTAGEGLGAGRQRMEEGRRVCNARARAAARISADLQHRLRNNLALMRSDHSALA